MFFEHNIEEELLKLQAELQAKTYKPGTYREFTIYERKPRRISAAPYRDRVVHHALCNIINPIFEKVFVFDSYACRIGKGTHRAADRFTQFCRNNRYVLKTDIKKYFPSIDHEILFGKIQKKIKCRDTLWLIKTIIDGSNAQDYVLDYFPRDELLTPIGRPRGIPIGNLTSQFFANIYLDALDHYIKEQLRCRSYIRYVDDITVFGNNKKQLWEVKTKLEEFLAADRLKLHPIKTSVLPVEAGVDNLGYRIFPAHRRLRKDICIRFAKKYRMLHGLFRERRIPFLTLNASVQSWLGHAKHADTYGLRTRLLSCLEAGVPSTNGRWL